MKKFLLVLTIFIGLSVLAACGGSGNDDDNGDDIDEISIELSSSDVSVALGNTFTVTAEISPEDEDYEVVWSSADESVATVSDGDITGVSVGTTTITVTVEDVEETISVTVTKLHEWTQVRPIQDINEILGNQSNDNGNGGTTGDPYPEDGFVQGITDTTILVGNAAATSGAFAGVGVPFNAAIQAYFNMVNESGGVGGRTINFVHYDDEFSAEIGADHTRTLVEEDKVFALVGHFGTPTVGATYDYLNDEIGIPQVYYATGISDLFNPNASGFARASFPVQPIYDAEGEVMVARLLAEYNVEKIGVIYSSADDGQGMLNGIERRAGLLGIELVKQSVDAGATDMSTAALNIFNADVDAIIIAANQAPFTVATKALYDVGNELPVVTSYVNADATLISSLETEIESEQFNVYASSWVNIFDPESATGFNDGYIEFAGQNPDYAANSFAMAGWIAAHYFVEGLRRVGEEELTWYSYIEAMESAEIENPMGGIVDFSNGSRVGTQAMALLKATVISEIE